MITKEDAVRRQLLAAVHLYADGADPLAIYALTSGPFAILKDISDARYKVIGEERDRLLKERRVDDLIKVTAGRPANERYSEAMVDVASIQFHFSYPSPKAFWAAFRAKFNFLKHADEKRGGETETLAGDIELEEAETLLLACVIAFEELGFAASAPLALYRDHCFAQRGLFDRCRGHRFKVGYDALSFADRIATLRRALDLIGQGVPIVAVG